MHLFYIDESADERLFVLAALAVPAGHWKDVFEKLRQFRLDLQRTDGIDLHAELHAWKFVSGRGNIADPIVPKGRRCQIFSDTLHMTATLPGIKLLTVVAPASKEEQAFSGLLLNIQKMMQDEDSYGLLICDQGKETSYTRYTHTLRLNSSIDNILEEPLFKDSELSYFIQLSDFCAYALLRQEHPLASKNKYGLNQAFKALTPICL